jgi:hypothetical protein
MRCRPPVRIALPQFHVLLLSPSRTTTGVVTGLGTHHNYTFVSPSKLRRPVRKYVHNADILSSSFFSLIKIVRVTGQTIRGSIPGRGTELSFTQTSSPTLQPTILPIQRVQRVLSLRVKRPGRKVDHSDPLSAEIKNKWMYTSAPPSLPHAFIACIGTAALVKLTAPHCQYLST